MYNKQFPLQIFLHAMTPRHSAFIGLTCPCFLLTYQLIRCIHGPSPPPTPPHPHPFFFFLMTCPKDMNRLVLIRVPSSVCEVVSFTIRTHSTYAISNRNNQQPNLSASTGNGWELMDLFRRVQWRHSWLNSQSQSKHPYYVFFFLFFFLSTVFSSIFNKPISLQSLNNFWLICE